MVEKVQKHFIVPTVFWFEFIVSNQLFMCASFSKAKKCRGDGFTARDSTECGRRVAFAGTDSAGVIDQFDFRYCGYDWFPPFGLTYAGTIEPGEFDSRDGGQVQVFSGSS